MGKFLNIITDLHKKTKRDYLARMIDEKVACSEVARKYSQEYWDGERRYGYGGYKYDGRQKVLAQKFIDNYKLAPDAKILDVGCGKGFLLHELKQLLPQATITGIDTSVYGLEKAKEEVKEDLSIHRAQDKYPFFDKEFDLVISITTLHNLSVDNLAKAVKEIERVGKNKYIAVESYRNVEELFNLQCWALTCESFFKPEEWGWLYEQFGYTGDYEFIYFE